MDEEDEDRFYLHLYPNRTLCDVLADARAMIKQVASEQQQRALFSLIEEMQIMGNRMEAGLSDKKDLFRLSEMKTKMREEFRKDRAKLKKLKAQIKKIEDNNG